MRPPSGKTFTVLAENNSDANIYIQSATLNGKPLEKPVIAWEEIQSGAILELRMGPNPSRWAAEWKPAPIAATRAK